MKKTKTDKQKSQTNPIIISRKLQFHYWERCTLLQPAESALPGVISHKAFVVSVGDLVNIPAAQAEQHKPRLAAHNINADSFPSGDPARILIIMPFVGKVCKMSSVSSCPGEALQVKSMLTRDVIITEKKKKNP